MTQAAAIMHRARTRKGTFMKREVAKLFNQEQVQHDLLEKSKPAPMSGPTATPKALSAKRPHCEDLPYQAPHGARHENRDRDNEEKFNNQRETHLHAEKNWSKGGPLPGLPPSPTVLTAAVQPGTYNEVSPYNAGVQLFPRVPFQPGPMYYPYRAPQMFPDGLLPFHGQPMVPQGVVPSPALLMQFCLQNNFLWGCPSIQSSNYWI